MAREKSGVYVLLVDSVPVYIGQCQNLNRRFNYGYGNISPRACYERGQLTNCRVNMLVLSAFREGKRIALHLHETRQLDHVEAALLRELNPPWNRTLPVLYRRPRSDAVPKSPTRNSERHVDVTKGKYGRLARHLAAQRDACVTLSFTQIEEIIGSRLSRSAYIYRVWWANGGHCQCNAWLNARYRVAEVVLDDYGAFERTHS